MAETMAFLPRADLLSFEEIEALVDIFVARGVKRVRLTGGEPLVRRGILDLVAALGTRIGHGLDELTMTTNGTQLAGAAEALAAAGVRRINVSLDTRDGERFAHITRRGRLAQVLEGIGAAKAAGLAVKINMVALNGLNEAEIAPMLAWCVAEGLDLSLIETMPLGAIDEDATLGVLLEMVDAAYQRALAGARWSAQDDLLTCAHREIDVRQGFEFAVPLLDVLHDDHRRFSDGRAGVIHGSS